MKDLSDDTSDAFSARSSGTERSSAKPSPFKLTPEFRVRHRRDVAREGSAPLGTGTTVEGSTGPIMRAPGPRMSGAGGGGGKIPPFHRRLGPEDFERSLRAGVSAVRRNMCHVMVMTLATNVLILAIPVYLFQISDRVLTSRSVDTLIMLTIVIGGAVILQAVFDAIRRFMLMRTAVEIAARLGAPILSAAAHASLHGTGREYQTLGDLQQLRGFLVSGTLISFLDVPFAPLFIIAIYLVHPHLGTIVVVTALMLLVIALINQKLTEKPFAEANMALSKANQHLEFDVPQQPDHQCAGDDPRGGRDLGP